MSAEPKRKISVTVDAHLVAELEATGENLSAQVNDALRHDLMSRRRERALARYLDRLATEEGPLDTPEDEREIQRLMGLLGGPAT